MKYKVNLRVVENIGMGIIEADSKEEAFDIAVQRAIKEHPKVPWMVDEFVDWQEMVKEVPE